MKLGTSGHADVYQSEGNRAEASISLNLHTFDTLNIRRIAEDLDARRSDIREQIFRNIAEQVIPDMVSGSGKQVNAPEQWSISSTGTTNWSMPTPKISNNTVSTDHHLDMNFSFQADGDIDPITTLYLVRDQIAAAAADNVVFSLKNYFLGKTEFKTSSESSMEDGKVKDYRVTDEAAGKEETDGFRWSEEAINDPNYMEYMTLLQDGIGDGEEAANEPSYSPLEFVESESYLEESIRMSEIMMNYLKKRIGEMRKYRAEALKEGDQEEAAYWEEELTGMNKLLWNNEDDIRADKKQLSELRARQTQPQPV